MPARFRVSLAHMGCDQIGSVIWEEHAGHATNRGRRPTVISLPRGFVSLDADDGSVEIICTGCRQTIASATGASATGASATGASATGALATDSDQASGSTLGDRRLGQPADTPISEPMLSEFESLFDRGASAASIPGGAIPSHLAAKLHHLAATMRRRAA